MANVKLTVVSSRCRSGYCKAGEVFIVDDLCPPLFHELWHCAYPMLYALKNGATLDYGTQRMKQFDVQCPDEGRVVLHGELME